MGILDNVLIRVQKRINGVDLHYRKSILTFKTEITSIDKVLNKIYIPRDMYETYA